MKFSWSRWNFSNNIVNRHKRWSATRAEKIKAEGTPVGPFCYINPNKRHRKQFAERNAGFARRAERLFKQEVRYDNLPA